MNGTVLYGDGRGYCGDRSVSASPCFSNADLVRSLSDHVLISGSINSNQSCFRLNGKGVLMVIALTSAPATPAATDNFIACTLSIIPVCALVSRGPITNSK